MENYYYELTATPQSIIPKIYQGPRKVVYSYLMPKKLIKVASLSKREREIVLNSKIVKENRKQIHFQCSICTTQFQKSCKTALEIKGLFIAVQLSSKISLELYDCSTDQQKIFEMILPDLIATAINGTSLRVVDRDSETLNGIVAAAIKKQGALINELFISQGMRLDRVIQKASEVNFLCSAYFKCEELFKRITEFPFLRGLKALKADKIFLHILARSQLEYLEVDEVGQFSALLPLLATQTQLKKVRVEQEYISDLDALITSLPKSVKKLRFNLRSNQRERVLYSILICTVQDVIVGSYAIEDLEELLNEYLDANQQSEGNRTRHFYGWNFRVSAQNRILNLQQPKKN